LVKEQGTNELMALKEITKRFLYGKPQGTNFNYFEILLFNLFNLIL